jgi:very-short-patch-repair endonuclease
MNVESLRVGRERLSRVFRFLAALNQHRNPPNRQIRDQLWTLWMADLPLHPSIRLGPLRVARDTVSDLPNQGSVNPEDFVIKVARPKLTRAPDPPSEIRLWLEPGWDEPSKSLSFRGSRNEVGTKGETVLVRFEDDPKRVSGYEQWRLKREEWAQNEKPARQAMKVFENFYELHGRLEREAERVELVLGDGVLNWRRPEGGIHHPVLLQRLQLTFDPAIPEFCVVETEQPVELYSALFQSMADVDGRAIGRCLQELEQGNYHPLGDDSTSGFLRRLIVVLSARGEFDETGELEGERDDPRIGRKPVLFLRARTLGFAAAIDAILQDLKERDDIPWSLLNVVGIDMAKETQGREAISPSRSREQVDVLLSKPANPEQIRIAQQTDTSGGVLVQGPPGTGKTHTIGNLIGHLLANGKSVLVTSHTTKALRMVRSQVVSKLRSLCVSVLESDLDSRKQLESAVGTIAERLSQSDAAALVAEAERLAKHRRELAGKIEDFRNRLIEARADEYRDIVLIGRSWAPSDAARFVASEQKILNWIPGPLTPGAGLPLSASQVMELYATNHSVPPDVERELAELLPDLRSLPTPAEFEGLVATRERLSTSDRGFHGELWKEDVTTTPESLSAIAARLEKAIEPLNGKERWKLAAVYAGKNGSPHREPWDNLVRQIESAHVEVAKSQEILLRYSTSVANSSTMEEQEQVALEICTHLRQGNELSFFTLLTRGTWKQFIQSARVNGSPPTLAEHFLALNKFCQVKNLRRDLASRWDRQMASLGAPPSQKLGDDVEKSAMQFCSALRDCLSWSSHVWAPLETDLKESGLRWDKFLSEQPAAIGSDGELRRLCEAVRITLLPMLASRLNALHWNQNERLLSGLREKLSIAKSVAANSAVTAELYESVCRLETKAYHANYSRLLELNSKRSELQHRNSLLALVEVTAPAWSAAIRGRSGVHAAGEVPGASLEAWNWRQLSEELERRASVSLEELQSSIEKYTEQLRLTTIDLIDHRAWAFQAERTSLSQRQALIGWLDLIRKIGKGTGIRVPRLRAEAAKKMTDCRGAVPVWVMPLSRVVENFDPRKSRFDVVIIDEASQSDVMALVALYLGRTVVVVGDHEQVSPSAVGQEVAVVQNLIDQFLQGIPNAELYDGQTSVYDLARQSFGGTIRLVEHFRCVTEIIQFSNQLSYEGDIKPLRDASRVALRPHTLTYRVSGSTRDGKVNRQEAEVVTSLIAAALEQPEYQTNEFKERSSFGVVSLVGEDQAIEIDRLLRTHIPPDLYEGHRLLCGTPAQFQGDERDVMLISVVDVPTGTPLPFRDQQMFKQRFNVAASRARDQMWVVHSLNVKTDLRAGDLRRRLIEHAEDPEVLLRVLEDKERRTESPFERDVMRKLLLAGYQVTPQWKVGSRRIDLVVEGNGRRLAVECDGDRYHPHEKLAEDMERQAMLERLGWVFARIRGSVFFRDSDRAMKTVFDKLQRLEIQPSFNPSATTQVSTQSTELTDRVARRAEQIRNEWAAREATAPTS